MANDMEFEFDLVFALPHRRFDLDVITDSLFEGGCDDALVGVGAAGTIGLAFTRSGEDAESVIMDAVNTALAALPEGSRLREVRPDLVSQGDVAKRLGVSRQALQKRELPPPSVGGLYRATELFIVLQEHPGKVQEALEDARAWFAAATGAQRINARMGLRG